MRSGRTGVLLLTLVPGELAAADPQWLIDRFGANYGGWLHEAAHGRDERPLVTHREPKSLSRETTFERDLHPQADRESLGAVFTRLCAQLAVDLQGKGYWAKTIGVKLRYDDFKTITRETTLAAPTQDANTIRRCAGHCLKNETLAQRIRLLGVRAGSLCKADALPAAGETKQAVGSVCQFDLPLAAGNARTPGKNTAP